MLQEEGLISAEQTVVQKENRLFGTNIIGAGHWLCAFSQSFLQRKDTSIMRLDKFLKVSRIIKRRTVANEACSGGRVSINGKVAKPAADVKEGDELEIRFGNRVGKYKILSVKETVRKENAQDMYQVLEEDAQTKAERSVGE